MIICLTCHGINGDHDERAHRAARLALLRKHWPAFTPSTP